MPRCRDGGLRPEENREEEVVPGRGLPAPFGEAAPARGLLLGGDEAAGREAAGPPRGAAPRPGSSWSPRRGGHRSREGVADREVASIAQEHTSIRGYCSWPFSGAIVGDPILRWRGSSDVRNSRLRRPEEGRSHTARGPQAPRVPRLRFGGHSRRAAATARLASVRSRRQDPGPQGRRAQGPGRRPGASATRVGRRMAASPRPTPIRTSTPRARSRSCTTASSRTTAPSARCSPRRASSFYSETDTEVIPNLDRQVLRGRPRGGRQGGPGPPRGHLRHRRHPRRRARAASSARATAAPSSSA